MNNLDFEKFQQVLMAQLSKMNPKDREAFMNKMLEDKYDMMRHNHQHGPNCNHHHEPQQQKKTHQHGPNCNHQHNTFDHCDHQQKVKFDENESSKKDC